MGEAKGKVAVLCLPGLEGFLGNVVQRLEERYEVRTYYGIEEKDLLQTVQWADVVWLEWANELAVQLTQHPSALDNKKVICRLHSYEAISGYVAAIDWNKIDECIFVAEHVRRVALDQLNQLKDAGKLSKDFGVWVIPNGIDVSKYRVAKNKQHLRNYNLAVLGHISHKKGPQLMLHAFHRLHTLSKKYKLFVGGRFQEARYALYLNHMSGQLKLQDHMKFVGMVEDVNDFFKDKSFILCTSPWEGCPVGVLEGMACGCKPLIHNFLGAEALYPKEFLWNTIPELTALLKKKEWNPASYRKFVDDNYSLNTMLLNIEQVVDSCFLAAPAVRGGVATVGDVVELGAELNRVVDEVDREIHLFEKPEDLLPEQPPKVMPELVKVKGSEIGEVDWDKAQGKAVRWVFNNTDKESGLIKISHKREGVYPEVSGYLVPTLMRLRSKAMAYEMAADLACVQQEDGSWLGTDGRPYAFDTAQALRGMLTAWDQGFGVPKEDAEVAAKKAIKWLVGSMDKNGRFLLPIGSTAWNMGERGSIPEEIHLYCLPPLYRYSAKKGRGGQELKVLLDKSKAYYLQGPDKLTEFNQPNMSSHFFCYIQEALIELGETGLARKGMESLKQYIGQAGDVPAFSNVPWVNSAGQAQAALCFFRLGEKEFGEKLLKFMSTLQLPSGGFYGSYGYQAEYFTDEQIPWPVKFFLDALWWTDRPVLDKPKSSKKVLAVVPNDPLQAYVDAGYPDQTEYFNPTGYWDEVYCISPQEYERKEMYGMKVWPTAPSEFNQALRDCGADVLRIYDMRVLNVLANQEKPPIPLVCSVHDVNPKRVSAQWPKVDHFMAVSKAVKDFLTDSVGVPEEKIEVIPNRVDMERFKPVEDRIDFNLVHGRKAILFVGRLVEQKNLDTLIKALRVLGDEYWLIVVGKGDEKKYQKIAKEEGCLERITWRESLAGDELPLYYSSCDCFCVPSRWEGFGIVFIEALACGAIVVTSNIAPMKEFIEDGENGLLVGKFEDPEALAGTIRYACSEHADIDNMKLNTRDSVKQFSKEVVDEQEVEMYRKLLGAPTAMRSVGQGARKVRSYSVEDLQVVTDLESRPFYVKDWDYVVENSKDAWAFHWWEFQKINREVWNAEVHDFMVYDKSRPLAVCPLQRHLGNPHLIDSSIMGETGPVVRDDVEPEVRGKVLKVCVNHFRKLIRDEFGKAVKVSVPPLCRRELLDSPAENWLLEYGFEDISTGVRVLPLVQDTDRLYKSLRRNHRRDIEKAEKSGMTVSLITSKTEDIGKVVEQYYEIHKATYARAGLQPHPFAYFQKIGQYLISKDKAWMYQAWLDGKLVAATNILVGMGAAKYWTAANDELAYETGAQKYLVWLAVKRAKKLGLGWIELGEVFQDPGEDSKLNGLTKLKSGWGDPRNFWKGVLQ